MASFRVIIVGGGIGGLTLANCLQHASIDFVLLESREEIGLHIVGGVGVGKCLLEPLICTCIACVSSFTLGCEQLFLTPSLHMSQIIADVEAI
jgi:heterodisulfide reductase subunit A-like polyferredoxin